MPNFDPFSDRRRYQLILGKFPITELTQRSSDYLATIDVAGGKFFMRFSVPANADIRQGDLLTLYTEVLARERPDA